MTIYIYIYIYFAGVLVARVWFLPRWVRCYELLYVHMRYLPFNRAASWASRDYRRDAVIIWFMVHGEFPCCLAGGRLDSVGAVVCLALCYFIRYCVEGWKKNTQCTLHKLYYFRPQCNLFIFSSSFSLSQQVSAACGHHQALLCQKRFHCVVYPTSCVTYKCDMFWFIIMESNQ
jgi:hypothetical protein